jgi:hypothetical protein
MILQNQLCCASSDRYNASPTSKRKSKRERFMDEAINMLIVKKDYAT